MFVNLLVRQKAAEDDAFAQHELGLRYLLGKNFIPDTAKAVFWIKKAADKKLPPAMFNLGLMYNGQTGVAWNPFAAFNYFKSAAEAGLPEAQFVTGLFYLDNFVVNRNYQTAYKWLKAAKNSGFEKAASVIEEISKTSKINFSDTVTTDNKYFSSPAALLDTVPSINYVDINNESKKIDDAEYVKSLFNSDRKKFIEETGASAADTASLKSSKDYINLLHKTADLGSPEALLILGKLYENGINAKKDIILASEYYLRALRLGSFKASEYLLKFTRSQEYVDMVTTLAKKNNISGMYVYAGLTAMGFMNNTVDDRQAFDLLNKAAKQNHIPSLIETGLCYSSGTLVARNTEKAVEFWQKAANLGSNEASTRIAIIKTLTQKDTSPEVFNSLLKAADNGSVIAQSALGFCYEKGLSVKQNKGTAVQYYRNAAHRGNRSAYEALQKMYDEMRPDEEIFRVIKEQ